MEGVEFGVLHQTQSCRGRQCNQGDQWSRCLWGCGREGGREGGVIRCVVWLCIYLCRGDCRVSAEGRPLGERAGMEAWSPGEGSPGVREGECAM